MLDRCYEVWHTFRVFLVLLYQRQLRLRTHLDRIILLFLEVDLVLLDFKLNRRLGLLIKMKKNKRNLVVSQEKILPAISHSWIRSGLPLIWIIFKEKSQAIVGRWAVSKVLFTNLLTREVFPVACYPMTSILYIIFDSFFSNFFANFNLFNIKCY